MKLYDGCYGVLNNGEVVGPIYGRDSLLWPWTDGVKRQFFTAVIPTTWTNEGSFGSIGNTGNDIRSVHPTREEAESAARGETVKPKRKLSIYRLWHLIAAFLLGVAVTALFACTSPTEPAPHCQYQEHTFSHDSGLDTVICLDSIAYGRG